ncbi:HAD-IIB family hydrolase [Marinomonas sp.]|nr:HAD family hydrolase [Marinomonas sp.]MDB4837359.1 HAD-IIB family hydrolase [Marinomonas sp.]
MSDLDGTLLRDDQTLSHETQSFLVDAIKKGLNFTYATARSIASSRFVLESLDIKIPVILYNGAQIYCPSDDTYIHSAYLDPDSYKLKLNEFLSDGMEPVVHCLDSEDNLRVYFQSISNDSTAKWINSRLKNGDSRFRVTKDFSEVDPAKVVELMVVATKDEVTKYEKRLSSDTAISYVLSEDIYCKGFYWLELNHTNANKGHAVEVLREYLGLKNIVSFGDNHNDVPMFEKSNRSLAVSNAKLAVQKAASNVIASNNEDAVIRFIKQNETSL